MAKAVNFREFTPRNSRDDLIHRLEQAPAEHVEAMLAGYELLQRLYDTGIIDLVNGLLSAEDAIVERVTSIMNSKASLNVLRTAVILGSVVTSIEPDKLQAVIDKAENDQPLSLLSIVKQATSKDARRGIAASVALLNILGEALQAKE